jgi:hypothetical protein
MKPKSCFFICPIGSSNSETRTRANKVQKEIIEAVAVPLNYKIARGDLEPSDKPIPDSITQHIFYDDLVIADLTDSNANVFFELGKRHAWGGRCIHLAQDLTKIPFDLSHHKVLEYNLNDETSIENTKLILYQTILALERLPAQCPYPLTPERVVELTNSTVVIDRQDGHRDHYYLAQKMAQEECKSIFLMQRSSTLILGPEYGWEAERGFYHAVIQQINKGVEFYHIVSLEGIARHLARPQSSFRETDTMLRYLETTSDYVGIKGPNKTWDFKRVPDEMEEADLKPDRQARTFIVETAQGITEGVIVVDLGGMQSCFRIRGPKMTDFLHSCIEFYDKCHYLKWVDLRRVLANPGKL